MRNLKKILALVLALMMVLSVMVTASAADFTDADTISHAEAVEVMVAAGVLNGIPVGDTVKFDPTGNIDRASAAKLVTYLLLGTDIDMVEKTETEFSDVKASNWASGFIAFCAEEGIVAGDGSGKFNPTNPIDGYSFIKMVLLALGHEEDNLDEGEKSYTGTTWKTKIRIALRDLNYELTEGLEDVNLNSNISREHASQIVFNALVNEGLIADFGIAPGSDTTDSFGRLITKVWVDGDGNTVYSEPAGLVASYTAATDSKDIAEDLGLESLSNNATANGTLVEYYWNAAKDKYSRIVIEYTTVAVGVAEADENGTVVYTLGTNEYKDYTDEFIAAEAAENRVKADTVVLYGDVKDGDIVTYVVDKASVAHVYPTTTVTGTLTAKNTTTNTLTIDGTPYIIGASANEDTYSFGAISVQLDQYGYVVAKTPVEGEDETPETPDSTLVIPVLNYEQVVGATEGGTDEYGQQIAPSEGVTTYWVQVLDITTGETYSVQVEAAADQPSSIGYYYNYTLSYDEEAEVNYATFSYVSTGSATKVVGQNRLSSVAGIGASKITAGSVNYYLNEDYVIYYYNGVGNALNVLSVAGDTELLEAALEASAIVRLYGEKADATDTTTNNFELKYVVIDYIPETDDGEEEPSDETYTNGTGIIVVLENLTSTNEVAYVKADGTYGSAYAHKVLVNGVETTITYATSTISAGNYTYKTSDVTGLTVLASATTVETATVENLYKGLITVGTFEDYDVADVTVINLTGDEEATLVAGADVLVQYHVVETDNGNVKVIDIIYLVPAAE